jgi:hypothetical protein
VGLSTAEKIRQLSKKFIESGDESVIDELKNAFSDAAYIPIRERCFVERYKKAVLEVHFHIVVTASEGDSVAENMCAVAKVFRPTNGQSAELDTSGVTHQFKRSPMENAGKSEVSVFVDIFEMVQLPEGVVLRNVPSVVRLQTLDNSLCLQRDAAKLVPFNLHNEVVCGFSDWEHIAATRSFAISENELPDNIIESGTEVIEKFPENNMKARIDVGEVEKHVDCIRVGACLTSNATMLFMSKGHVSYRCEMFLSPDDFVSNSIERMIHDEK